MTTALSMKEVKTLLTMSTRCEWQDEIGKLGNALGPHGMKIMNSEDPIPETRLPKLNQLYMINGVCLPKRYQFGTITTDIIDGIPYLDENGLPILLTHSADQCTRGDCLSPRATALFPACHAMSLSGKEW